MYVYLELPEGRVPADLIDGTKVVIRVTLSVKSQGRGQAKVAMIHAENPARGLEISTCRDQQSHRGDPR